MYISWFFVFLAIYIGILCTYSVHIYMCTEKVPYDMCTENACTHVFMTRIHVCTYAMCTEFERRCRKEVARPRYVYP